MNSDNGGDEAEDWFARFEREAREAAQQRDDAADASPASPRPLNEPVPPPPAAQPIAPWEQPPVNAWDLPTQAVPHQEPEPTQAMPFLPDEPTQALVPAPLRPPGEAEPGSALDALFGDDRFQEYDASLRPDMANAPALFGGRPNELVHVPVDTTPPPRGFGRTQKILAGVGGGLLAIIAIIALFLLGTRLPDLFGPAPAVAPSPTPTPTMTALPIGPVAAGVHRWDDLLGGECLEPYDTTLGAWADEYTVVDCAQPHTAQMVFRAWFPPAVVDEENPVVGKPTDPFPGEEALALQIVELCGAKGVVDLSAAKGYLDLQIQGSYPVTEEQWEADPSYYCFVTRSSGEQLTESVAVAPVAPTPSVSPSP